MFLLVPKLMHPYLHTTKFHCIAHATQSAIAAAKVSFYAIDKS